MHCVKCNDNRDIILAKLTDKNGVQTYCPNCLTLAFLNNQLKIENNPEFLDDITGQYGAVKYESYDESYCLEKETMLRLISHNLEADEYFSLVAKYGAKKFELHDDFYDPLDGEAIQPVGK